MMFFPHKKHWTDKIELARVQVGGVIPSDNRRGTDKIEVLTDYDEYYEVAYLVGNMSPFLVHLYEGGSKLEERRKAEHVAYFTHRPKGVTLDPVVVKYSDCYIVYELEL